MATRLMTFKWCKENNSDKQKSSAPTTDKIMTKYEFNQYYENDNLFSSYSNNECVTRVEIPDVIPDLEIVDISRLRHNRYRIRLRKNTPDDVTLWIKNHYNGFIHPKTVSGPGNNQTFTISHPANPGTPYEFSVDQINWKGVWGIMMASPNSYLQLYDWNAGLNYFWIDMYETGGNDLIDIFHINKDTSQNKNILSIVKGSVTNNKTWITYNTTTPGNQGSSVYMRFEEIHRYKTIKITRYGSQIKFYPYGNYGLITPDGNPYSVYYSNVGVISRLFDNDKRFVGNILGLKFSDDDPNYIFDLQEGQGNTLMPRSGNYPIIMVGDWEWVRV